MIIYQAITRLWGKGQFASWDNKTLEYLKSLSVDFLYLVGIPRHATAADFVKGEPGCPYSISDWYDTNPYFSSNDRFKDFELLVKRIHKSGLKLMIDYIPNHVAKDYVGDIQHFNYCDGDWTDTLKNDWNSSETVSAMVDILKFWASKGVDGFRCDMVELVACDKLGYVISEVKKEYPSLVFVAEVYNKDNYHKYLNNGFDLLYDKSGLYDSLISIYKGYCGCEAITANWQSLGSIQDKMLNFLENHDEQRIASVLGDATKAIAGLGVSALFNNSSFMLYFGQEIGENAAESDNLRTSIFNWTKPLGIKALWNYVHGKALSDNYLNILEKYRSILYYKKLSANFKNWDLMYCNNDRLDNRYHFAFVRYNDREAYIVVCNFSPNPAELRLRIPEELQSVFKAREISVSVDSWDITKFSSGLFGSRRKS